MANTAEVGQQIADAIVDEAVRVLGRAPPHDGGAVGARAGPARARPRTRRCAPTATSPTITDADGTARQLVANPVQFDETPPDLQRAPQFAEHTDEILRELGKDEDEILQLKIDGACT